MNLGHLLFSFSGRINRAKYWLAVLVYFVVGIVALLAVLASFGGSLTGGDIFGRLMGVGAGAIVLVIVLTAALIVSSLAVAVKRLHDRNKSGWWILVFYVLPGMLQSIAESSGSTPAAGALGLLSFAISIWAFVELGCLRGTEGPNDYGPDPLG